MKGIEMMEQEFTTCPNCPGKVDSTIKTKALNFAAQGQGYASTIYVDCPTCGTIILARLDWEPVVVEVGLAESKPVDKSSSEKLIDQEYG
jgi:uncharacterized Zn finger protein